MINLNYRDPRPFYEQIKLSIISLIASGALATGEKLPSVRELASQLAINPNTIQRAYRELEAEHYVYSVAGRGSFVSDFSAVAEGRRRELFEKLNELCALLRESGADNDMIIEHIKGGAEK